MNAQSIVAKVWNFAHVLRDQGVSYQAYISQISYLLFLKMDEERATLIGEASMVQEGARWGDIKDLSGEHTIILSTHILSEVEHSCQKVIIISQGKLVATDSVMGSFGVADRMRM